MNLSERIEDKLTALKALFEDNLSDGRGIFDSAELALAGVIQSLFISSWHGEDLGALLYALRNESGRLAATAPVVAADDAPVPFVPADEECSWGSLPDGQQYLSDVACRLGISIQQAHTCMFLALSIEDLRAAIVRDHPMVITSKAAATIETTIMNARYRAGTRP